MVALPWSYFVVESTADSFHSQNVCHGNVVHEDTTSDLRFGLMGQNWKYKVGESPRECCDLTRDREKETALSLLRNYHIFAPDTTRVSLNESFAKGLQQALTGTEDGTSFGQIAPVTNDETFSPGFLDKFAVQQWEAVLGYIIGSSTGTSTSTTQPNSTVIKLLEAGNLIAIGPSRQAKITKDGFAFVLQDINTQLWTMIFLYVSKMASLDVPKVEVLAFIFQICSLQLGLAYNKQDLSQTQLRMLADLFSFGLIHQRSSKALHFHPTRLAATLTSTSASLSSSLLSSSNLAGQGEGFIVIETNFRVYAYTSSDLQIALLSLFVNLRSRHPNLVTGKMTKRSVQRAVQGGITADQIIGYLSSHAHPQMRRVAAAAATNPEGVSSSASNNPNQRPQSILPGTIIDQINLWQLERDRMQATVGCLFKDFESQSAFEGICTYADDIGVLVWRDERKRMFFVTRYEAVRDYMSKEAGKH